ncbi:PAS domain S-box protein [Bacillus sp. PS06]|uniref:PAS domain S-box protein n=1 Tax=Bacillus sp. PS06 TaxID=2764176 RepID=UPI00177C7283|nr:PAS domain S-box protein [Bacillus sp. PS06]MBD8067856.1 PAS domain S-box protein [Bacillus sp. PS06]
MINFIDRFEQAFYYSPIGMALVSLEGNWIKVNPALAKITGYTEEELLSRTFQDITYPDDIEADINQVQELIDGKKDYFELEKRYIHKNGTIVWVLLSVSVVREENKSLYLISQVQEITERKQLELNLIESEEKFRSLLTHSPDAILVHDGTNIIYANKSAADLVGTTVEDIEGVHIQEFIDPTIVEEAYRMTQEILLENKPILDIEATLRSKNGKLIDTVFSASPINFMGRRAVLLSYRDITERKKIEQALTESEERYRSLVEYAPLGILVHQNNIIKYANSTALQLLGTKKPEDIIGLHFRNIIHPDYRLIVTNRVKNSNVEPSSPCYERFIRLDGKEIDVEVNGIPVQLNGESAVQLVFWDVTEKKKEEDLIRYRAYHDTLTDLPNRLKFQLDIAEEINEDKMFTIMYLDLHGLKQVNDAYGHQAGDTALIKITARLSGAIGHVGLIYRLGGDEFAIVLPNHKNDDEIRDIATNIAEVIKQPIYIGNTIVNFTTSIGIVYYPNHGVDIELLLRHADMAMYHAKKTKTLYKIYDK